MVKLNQIIRFKLIGRKFCVIVLMKLKLVYSLLKGLTLVCPIQCNTTKLVNKNILFIHWNRFIRLIIHGQLSYTDIHSLYANVADKYGNKENIWSAQENFAAYAPLRK